MPRSVAGCHFEFGGTAGVRAAGSGDDDGEFGSEVAAVPNKAEGMAQILPFQDVVSADQQGNVRCVPYVVGVPGSKNEAARDGERAKGTCRAVIPGRPQREAYGDCAVCARAAGRLR